MGREGKVHHHVKAPPLIIAPSPPPYPRHLTPCSNATPPNVHTDSHNISKQAKNKQRPDYPPYMHNRNYMDVFVLCIVCADLRREHPTQRQHKLKITHPTSKTFRS